MFKKSQSFSDITKYINKKRTLYKKCAIPYYIYLKHIEF